MSHGQQDSSSEQEYLFTHTGIEREKGYMTIPTEWTWTPELLGVPLAALVVAANIHVEGRPVTASGLADAMSIDVEEARGALELAVGLEFVERIGPPNGRAGLPA